MAINVWRGSERYRDVDEGRVTLHAFSFGHHYDPTNLAFGPLRAFDDHLLEAGAGFDEHRHSDVELVTWVQEGTLVHTGPDGVASALRAGSVQVQSAGSGIRHCERAAHDTPTRFVQSWLVPDEADLPPARHASAPRAPEHASGPLRPVAGEGTALPVRSAGATLWTGTLVPGSSAPLPTAQALFLFVLGGCVEMVTGISGTSTAETQPTVLEAGDSLRATEVGHALLRVPDSSSADVLLWSFASS